MWGIRGLSGRNLGQLYPLKTGRNTMGRAVGCTIQINDPGISKEHAELTVYSDRLVLLDMNSRNGTFVNGVRIKSKTLKLGDRFSLNECLFDVVPLGQAENLSIARANSSPMAARESNEISDQPPAFDPNMPPRIQKISDLPMFFSYYLEQVMLPGIYRLARVLEFRDVLAGFIFLLIAIVTVLSTLPMIRITKASIEQESRRRALTIARNLAAVNERAVIEGVESALTTHSAQIEEGVKKALIISNLDGHILAPPKLAGSFAPEPFVVEARRNQGVLVSQIDSETIGAAVPVQYYNSERGTQSVAAFALVIYDMGALAIDDGRTISLFFQTLLMALVVGGLVFYFLYKLIRYPFAELNREIDHALRNGTAIPEIEFRFSPFQQILGHINTLLNRATMEGKTPDLGARQISDRNMEADHLVRTIGTAAMTVSASTMQIMAMNSAFEAITGLSLEAFRNQEIQTIPDVALQQNLEGLLSKLRHEPQQVAGDMIDFGGHNFQISGQAIFGDSQVAYYIITLQPAGANQLGGSL